jgi:hypothetical protein
MKTISIFKPISVALKHLALAACVSAALVAGSARAATTTSTYDLGASGSGTLFAVGELIPWIAQGTLPIGSILREVSINATLDDSTGGSWASDLNVLVDGLLQIGSDGGSIDWANGQDSNIGATVIDTKTAGVDFPATIDLGTAGLFLTNPWSDSTWSGSVTVKYDVPGVADIISLGLPGSPAVINGNQITWALPAGTNVTALAPIFTISAGATCDHISGTAYDFSSPVHFVVTSADALTVNDYTVTALVEAPWGMINVNFDTAARTGLVGPAGGAGSTWNEQLDTAGLTAAGLLGASGAATSVGFTCNAQHLYSWGDPTLKMLTAGAFQWEWDTPTGLVISGLTSGRKYTLYIASFHPNELGGRSLFSTSNPTTTQGVQIADNYGPNGNDHAWVRGLNYVRFDNIEADAAKCITITMACDSGTSQKRAYLSGFQLVEDPPAGADPYVEWIATFDFSAYTDPDLSPTGDPDVDGITNQVEYAYGLNPTLADGFPNGLTRERWDFIEGRRVADLTGNRGRFLNAPDDRDLVPNLDDSGSGENSAYRYRGFLTAPVTGIYRFWISGNAEAELWLADGTVKQTLNGLPATPGNPLAVLTDRYGKSRIASIEDPHSVENFSAPLEFDKYPSQRSRPVELVAGESYYFEVLHKQWTGDHHVAVAWQVPGATRQIIPTGAFSADATQADDHDSDNLPDAWEATHGLNPDDSGLSNAGDGQYGDWDADGLTNLEEFQLGTNPTLADTDGDGLSDKDERDYYHTDPLVANSVNAVTYATLPPHAYASATGYWSRDASGSLTAIERRGEITYNFTVAQGDAGIFEIVLTGGAAGIPRPVENLPLVFSINGNRIGATTLTSLNGVSTTTTLLTPWLKAGAYTLTILHDNYRAALKLRIDSLLIRRLAGFDANGNHRPDWLEQRLAATNRFTRVPATSLTSPLCIEGVTSEGVVREGVNRRIPGLTLKVDNEPLAPTPSVDSSFYANVPLSESAPVTLSATFQSGALAESKEIIWSPTNLRAYHTLHIRKGDALRLDAWNNAGVPGNNTSFTVTMDGTLLADDQANTTHTSGQPFTVTFDTAGTHTLVVTYGNKPPHTTTLHVHRATFGPALSVRAYHPRDWTPPSISRKLIVEADSRLSWQETTATDGPRSFRVMPFEAAERHVIARIPDDASGAPCAIVDRGTLNAFYLAYIDETGDAVLVHTFPDGSRLMRGSIVAVGLPPDVYIRIISLFQGTLFINGADTLWLTAADFDQNGIANIYYEWDGEGDPKMCTGVDLFTTTPPPAEN